jgi:choline kinase
MQSEWCYNYHDPEKPYVCNTIAYPNIDEQKRFIKAYVQHQPGRRSQAPTPLLGPSAPSGTPAPISSISTFMLDSRAPPSQITDEDEKRDKAMAEEVDKLLLETKIWRVACSAQWVAWGVVQANLPGLDAEMAAKEDHSDQPAVSSGKDAPHQKEHLQSDGLPEGEEPDNKPEDDEEFDYLGYAQERAMFFWGDVIELDIVKPEDLPKELLEKVKFVKS